MNAEELYVRALDFISTEGTVGYQFLQRRLRINFGKAHDIMKRLESEGYIEVESLPTGFIVRLLKRPILSKSDPA